MEPRFDLVTAAPNAFEAMLGLESYIRQCGLPSSLIQLVKMRASQINGCAYCLAVHSKEALAIGETEQRLYQLDTWRESPLYTARERAALSWTEALTLIADSHAPDEIYDQVHKQFSIGEIMNISLLISTINGWNRLCIGARLRYLAQ